MSTAQGITVSRHIAASTQVDGHVTCFTTGNATVWRSKMLQLSSQRRCWSLGYLLFKFGGRPKIFRFRVTSSWSLVVNITTTRVSKVGQAALVQQTRQRQVGRLVYESLAVSTSIFDGMAMKWQSPKMVQKKWMTNPFLGSSVMPLFFECRTMQTRQ